MTGFINHLYIIGSVLFAIMSQLIIRWQVGIAGPLPADVLPKLNFIVCLLLTPWVILALLFTFLSGISWMLALTKFEMSYAYPWISVQFIIIPLLSLLIFQESVSTMKFFGMLIVAVGLYLIGKS